MDTQILWICNFVSFVVYARTTVMHSKSASVDTPRQSAGRWVGILLSSVTQAILYYALYSLRTFFSFLWSGASNVTRSMTPAMNALAMRKALPFRLQNNTPPSRAYWHIRWECHPKIIRCQYPLNYNNFPFKLHNQIPASVFVTVQQTCHLSQAPWNNGPQEAKPSAGLILVKPRDQGLH